MGLPHPPEEDEEVVRNCPSLPPTLLPPPDPALPLRPFAPPFPSRCVGGGKLAKLCCCCVQCCLGCFEKSLKFVTRNAYVQMMISGQPFCTAAMSALATLVKNLASVAVVRGIGTAFLFFGKLFIAAMAGGLGALILLTQKDELGNPYRDELYSLSAPVTAIVLLAWLVAKVFMGVYNVAIDTIFLCYCVDRERAGHNLPTFGSASLQKLIHSNGASTKAEYEQGVPVEVSASRTTGGQRVSVELSRAARPPPPDNNPFVVVGEPVEQRA